LKSKTAPKTESTKTGTLFMIFLILLLLIVFVCFLLLDALFQYLEGEFEVTNVPTEVPTEYPSSQPSSLPTQSCPNTISFVIHQVRNLFFCIQFVFIDFFSLQN
jgi:hypothetical protein